MGNYPIGSTFSSCGNCTWTHAHQPGESGTLEVDVAQDDDHAVSRSLEIETPQRGTLPRSLPAQSNRLPCRRTSPLRHRHSRDHSASDGARLAPPGDSRSQTPRHRSWQTDGRTYRVIAAARCLWLGHLVRLRRKLTWAEPHVAEIWHEFGAKNATVKEITSNFRTNAERLPEMKKWLQKRIAETVGPKK
jgi:hypothetical protein